jgi:DNA-binding IclR family transcriptional regulator
MGPPLAPAELPAAHSRQEKETARVVEKAMDVLFCLAEAEEELGVTELDHRLGLGKTIVHRLLTTLERRDLVRRNPLTRRYRLGYGTLTLGNAMLRRLDMRALALPYLRELRNATGETASLTVQHGAHRIHLEQVESLAEIRFSLEVGKPLPAIVGASGKVLVAWLPEAELDQLLAATGLPALTPQSITDRQVLRDALARVREQGFAVSDSERFPGIASVAAPVRDYRGTVAAAINVTGPSGRLTPDRARAFGPTVARAAAGLSGELGWRERQTSNVAAGR